MRAPLLACLALLGLLCRAAQGVSDPRESALRLGLGLGSGDDEKPGKTICESRKHRKATMKLVKETPFVGLFRDLKNQSIFEASGMALLEGKYYVVFDRQAGTPDLVPKTAPRAPSSGHALASKYLLGCRLYHLFIYHPQDRLQAGRPAERGLLH